MHHAQLALPQTWHGCRLVCLYCMHEIFGMACCLGAHAPVRNGVSGLAAALCAFHTLIVLGWRPDVHVLQLAVSYKQPLLHCVHIFVHAGGFAF